MSGNSLRPERRVAHLMSGSALIISQTEHLNSVSPPCFEHLISQKVRIELFLLGRAGVLAGGSALRTRALAL
jgi:hypothetical protein